MLNVRHNVLYGNFKTARVPPWLHSFSYFQFCIVHKHCSVWRDTMINLRQSDGSVRNQPSRASVSFSAIKIHESSVLGAELELTCSLLGDFEHLNDLFEVINMFEEFLDCIVQGQLHNFYYWKDTIYTLKSHVSSQQWWRGEPMVAQDVYWNKGKERGRKFGISMTWPAPSLMYLLVKISTKFVQADWVTKAFCFQ